METEEQNRLLTQVGRGTPMGQLLRRYWQPIAAAVDLENNWTKRVRLLGEDLVLFKDRQGRLGLIAEHQEHRPVSAVAVPYDISGRAVYRWRPRYRAEGAAGRETQYRCPFLVAGGRRIPTPRDARRARAKCILTQCGRGYRGP